MSGSSPIIADDEDDDFPPVNDEPPVLCRDCDHVHPTTRKDAPYHWRCMKAPEKPLGGFQDPDWQPTPPWHLCRHINTDGACEFFVPLRKPKEATDV